MKFPIKFLQIFVFLFLILFKEATSQVPTFRSYYSSTYKLTSTDKLVITKVFPDFSGTEFIDSRFAFTLQTKAQFLKDSIDALATTIENQGVTTPADNNRLIALRSLSADYKITINLLEAINRLTGRPKWNNVVIPVRKSSDAQFFYEGVQNSDVHTVNSIAIQGRSDRGIVNTEVISGYVSIFRLNFNTVFLATKDTTTSLNTIEKVFQGGGLTTLNISYPWLYFQRRNYLILSQVMPKFVGDFPILGSDIDKKDFIGYFDFGNELFIQLNEKDNKFNLFANFKVAKIMGTESFYSNIKRGEEKAFWIGQVNTGIKIVDRLSLNLNIPLFTSDNAVQPKAMTFGLTIFPALQKELSR